MSFRTLSAADEREDTEAVLERWSRRNELDALASIDHAGRITVQGAKGTTFAIFNELDGFERWCSQIDNCLIPWPIEED